MALLIWIGMQEGNQWAKELVIRDEGNKVWQYKWKFNDITRHVCLLPFASPRLPRRASYRNGRALKTRKWCEKTPDRRRFIQTGEYTATGQEAKPWEYAEGLQKQLLSSIIVVSLLLWCIQYRAWTFCAFLVVILHKFYVRTAMGISIQTIDTIH